MKKKKEYKNLIITSHILVLYPVDWESTELLNFGDEWINLSNGRIISFLNNFFSLTIPLLLKFNKMIDSLYDGLFDGVILLLFILDFKFFDKDELFL